MTLPRNIIFALSLCTLLTSCDKVKSIVDEVTGGDVPDERVEGRKRVVSAGPETVTEWKSEPNVLVAVDFYSEGSEQCRELAPILTAMAEKYGDKAVVLRVNVDRNSGFAQENGVSTVPDVRFYLNNNEVDKFVGPQNEDKVDGIFARYTEEIDGDLPVAKRAKEEKKPAGPITVQREKGYLPPGVERVKVPEDVNGAIQIQSPAMKQSEKEKPVVDMGPPPAEEKPEEDKQ